MNARDEILARVRRALEGVAAPAAPRGPAPGTPRPPAGAEGLPDVFEARLTAVGGHVHRVRDLEGAARVLAGLLGELGAGESSPMELAHSDDPRVVELAERAAALADPACATFDGSRDRTRLLACPVGLTGAQSGIAETGTLVLCSESERHRETSLVPEVHVALLDGATLVPTLGDALRSVHAAGVPPLVTLVTGPSRTADIELTLVVGVHGPRALHVLLLEP